jgi:hypothetical protein
MSEPTEGMRGSSMDENDAPAAACALQHPAYSFHPISARDQVEYFPFWENLRTITCSRSILFHLGIKQTWSRDISSRPKIQNSVTLITTTTRHENSHHSLIKLF